MVQISKKDKEKVLESIHSGEIDTAGLTMPALADSVVLAIKHHGFLGLLNDAFNDQRSQNLHIHTNKCNILLYIKSFLNNTYNYICTFYFTFFHTTSLLKLLH